MIKANLWNYLDSIVTRRRTVEFRSKITGGYCVIINGHNFGLGASCKSAFLDAVVDAKKRRKFDAR